jgi:hypothetical protein
MYYSCKFGIHNFYRVWIMTIFVYLNNWKLMIFLSLYIEYLKDSLVIISNGIAPTHGKHPVIHILCQEILFCSKSSVIFYLQFNEFIVPSIYGSAWNYEFDSSDFFKSCSNVPAGTLCLIDVESMLTQRLYLNSTLIQRCFNMCLLGCNKIVVLQCLRSTKMRFSKFWCLRADTHDKACFYKFQNLSSCLTVCTHTFLPALQSKLTK